MRKLLLATALAALAGTSHAELNWTTNPGTNVTFGGYDGAPLAATGAINAGWLNSQIQAIGPGTLTITFLGKEAGDVDLMSFNFGAQTLTNTAAVGSTLNIGINGSQALNFLFKDVTTGAAISNGGAASNYATYAVLGTSSPNSPCGLPVCEVFDAKVNGTPKTFDLILGFNDGYKGDADYDDMVVGLSYAPVPEPQTYAMMIAGLAAVGFMVRRRSQVKG